MSSVVVVEFISAGSVKIIAGAYRRMVYTVIIGGSRYDTISCS